MVDNDAAAMVEQIKISAKANEEKAGPVDFYSKIIIQKGRRRLLTGLLVLCFFIFAAFIFRDILSEQSWFMTAWPLVLLGLMVAAFPSTESWEYKNWQVKPQQYERHFSERPYHIDS